MSHLFSLLFVIPSLFLPLNNSLCFDSPKNNINLENNTYQVSVKKSKKQDTNSNSNYKDNEIVVTLTGDYSELYRNDKDSIIEVFDKEKSLVKLNEATCITNYDNISEVTLVVPLENKGSDKVYEAIEALKSNKSVSYVGPNFINKEMYTPNDPELINQWSISDSYSNIGAELAWDTTCGNKRVRVGIIDGGITNHEDLLANRVEGYDFVNNNTTTNESSLASHGTHVAGISSAVANNSKGISGIAPNVSVVPLQCKNSDGSYTSSTAVSAINYAISLWGTEKQISVLNYSISGFGKDTTVLNAVKSFPGLFVWAAGNNGDDVDDYTNITSFNCDNIISVGAMNSSLQRASFSNYGYGVTIYAPGVDVLSSINTSNYVSWDGTSMAAPHVTGTAALLYSKYPNLKVGEIKHSIVESGTNHTINTPHGNYSVKYLSVNGALTKAPTLATSSYAYLRLSVTGKSGSTWSVKIINDNNNSVHVAYNAKMCFDDDAKNFKNLVHVQEINVSANSYKIVSISENYMATSITAAIAFSDSSIGKRYISYADGLSQNGETYSTNRVRNNYQTQTLNFPNATSYPAYLSLQVVGRTGFIFYNWKIRITNNTNRLVYVSYNSKMCFEADGKAFTLSDIVNTYISSNGYIDVTISSNGFADYIAASARFSYYGFDLRRVTYANGLGQNGGVNSIGTNNHSLVRYLQNGGNVHES